MKLLMQSLKMTFSMMVLTGIIFPLIITVAANILFPYKAQGSLLKDQNGEIRGSILIGQNFSNAKYFHARPSAVSYDGGNSGGTNLGPSSKKLFEGLPDDSSTEADESFSSVAQLASSYREANNLSANDPIPADAITRSASGLDPHISLENALLQANRVAKARNLKIEEISNLIEQSREGKFLNYFGDDYVNVLKLNYSLDHSM